MTGTSRLLLPPQELSNCIFAAVVRDTRSVILTDMDRFNHFPASPLVGLSAVFSGETRIVAAGGGLAHAKAAAPLPALMVSGPQDMPIKSWNPGPVYALSIGFYPEAWAALTGQVASDLINETHAIVPDSIAKLVAETLSGENMASEWNCFCASLAQSWKEKRDGPHSKFWDGTARLQDWVRAIAIRAALSGTGGSVRTAERRLRRWTGNSKTILQFHAQVENLHALSVDNPGTPLAELALEAGYSDQSHMGRAVQRLSGLSPAQLNRHIQTEESFWCYRLMAERF